MDHFNSESQTIASCEKHDVTDKKYGKQTRVDLTCVDFFLTRWIWFGKNTQNTGDVVSIESGVANQYYCSTEFFNSKITL